MAEYTFKQFQEEYPNDAACLARVMELQYGGPETHCQVCDQRMQFHPMGKRRAYACQGCGHHIYPCAGTIFHKSRTKLTIWFFAMYLMTSTRHGVAAKEIERQTGVTYKCAWRICDELRKLMAVADARGPLGGPGKHVEIDETLVGGRLGRSYEHGAVNHDAKEYVRGIHHTNSIEGHWSLLKRAINGTHVHISSKHAWKYVAEFSYRRNMRHSHWAMFNLLVHAFALPRLAAG